MPKISLVIPTLNRPDDLTRCLNSITKLSKAFDEIIIIEQGDMDKTQAIVNQFTSLNIRLYFYPIKSIAKARNAGIEKAQGDFVAFVDDDTELDKDYVKVALEYFANNTKVVGITGRIYFNKITVLSFIKRLVTILLGINGFKTNIFKSGQNGDIFYKDKIQKVQWLQGASTCYRRCVLDAGYRYNQNFILWSFGEDVMLSYQIYKHYGDGSLMYVPAYKLIHYNSEEISTTDESVIRMMAIYRFIFWHKEVYQGSLVNLMAYLFGQVGFIIYRLMSTSNRIMAFKYFCITYGYILKNRHDIVNNTIDYNDFILKGKTN